MRSGEINFRVRYGECDPMNVAHHTAYAAWFEMGRTELLRSDGVSYADLEREGIRLAVVEIRITYRRPARYDDLLRLETRLVEAGHVKIMHEYTLWREAERLAVGSTTLACLTADGRAVELPPLLRGHADGTLYSSDAGERNAL